MAKIRTRARAVDMLGRQQIAGIQNAISELFKNAYDAYAVHVEIDYFEQDELLVVRDDGVGMTREDFEGRWLVLGTESKAGEAAREHYRPPHLEARPITGEKGIGRLAIALLGAQVLVLSRARRDDALKNTTMSFIHWGVFELPGVNLDEIEIPVENLAEGQFPTELEVTNLQQRFLTSVREIADAHPGVDVSRIVSDVNSFQPDPADLDAFFSSRDLGELSLSSASGTHFLIAPANPIVRIEIEAEERLGNFSFRKHLMGFCNDVFLETTPAPVKTAFRRWRAGALVGDELLMPELFFSAQDLARADHLIAGEVDEYGQFLGNVRVFDATYDAQVIPWKENAGKRTACGRFSVQFGYLMGVARESQLPLEDHADLAKKLEKLGGLYIYRDRIRVLPYGDNQVDWLDIEQRRTLGASYYFFSYRRLFGGIKISRTQNPELHEKAGREGFQQNFAYRQLRDILINLFLNLAAEFFRKGGSKTEHFEAKREEHARQAAALERREKQVATKRRRLDASLGQFFERVSSGLPESEIATLRNLTHARMQEASRIEDKDRAAAALLRAESEAIDRLQQLESSYQVRKPTGVGLTRALRRDWDAYLTEAGRLEAELFAPFREEVSGTLGQMAKEARLYIDQRKRLEDRLATLAAERQQTLQMAARDARTVANETRTTVFEVSQRALAALTDTVKRIEADLNRSNLDLMPPEDIERLRVDWERELTGIESRHREALVAARDMLSSLSENLGSGSEEFIEAMEERMLALDEQSDQDFEMVQLGLAVAIINHEFSAAIRNVRRSIQELGHIARRSEQLQPLYTAIRENFQHLDGHLNLFTPLQRRLYRSATKIDGKSIRNYVADLFGSRLDRHQIKLLVTEGFESSSLTGYPSTLYPVFINLVDNAISWLVSQNDDRRILFDWTATGFIVANNGPPIVERDEESIFERGFTRKPGGRGLGLFVSKRALNKEKMDLRLIDPPPGYAVAFEIVFPLEAPT